MAGRTADECDAGLKAEAPVARRAADVKRVDRGAIVLFNWLLKDAYCREGDQKDREATAESSQAHRRVGLLVWLKRSG